MSLKSDSKFVSYVLRHHPESIGLTVDKNGWASIAELREKATREGRDITLEKLQRIIAQSSKKRFIISEDETHVRAGYGHSIDVDLQLITKQPPEGLYHGTAYKNLNSIRRKGLHSGSRNFVHLSAHKVDARQVGARHGSPIILKVLAEEMAQEGHDFYQSQSEPGIWLTLVVPPEYIES